MKTAFNNRIPIRILALLAALLAALLVMLSACRSAEKVTAGEGKPENGTLTLYSLNLGEADAHLFLLPNGEAVVIDTGRKKQFDLLDKALTDLNITEISALILTHGHKDHTGGLTKLLKQYPVSRIYTAALSEFTFSKKAKSAVDSSGAEHILLSAGDTFTLGGVAFTVLSPIEETDDENNASLVLRIEYGKTAFLMMADAKADVEEALLSSGTDLCADVLKCGHHGKDDATTEEFLLAVSPKYAILTGCEEDEAGDSPGKRVTELLAQSGVTAFIMRKDFIAAVFKSDGLSVTASAE